MRREVIERQQAGKAVTTFGVGELLQRWRPVEGRRGLWGTDANAMMKRGVSRFILPMPS